MGKTIVVLGGGTGGVVAANILRTFLANEHDIILIDRTDQHHFRASFPLVLVNIRQLDDITRDLNGLRRKGIDFFQAEVQRVDTTHQKVITNAGNVSYDYLVISLGADLHPETVPGQREGSFNPYTVAGIRDLSNRLKEINGGRIVMFIASLPFTGTVGPFEIVLLLENYSRRRHLRERFSFTFVTPETSPLAMGGWKLGQSLRNMMEQRGIAVVTQAKVLSLDAATGHLILDGGIYIPGDLFIGIPSHWGPKALRNSILAEDGGWIEVNPSTLATRIERVYAVGDAAGVRMPVSLEWAPKIGFFAHYQAEVVARNIALEIAGKKPRFQFTGKASGAAMFSGFGTGRMLSVNAYATSGSRLIMLPPTRAGFYTKLAFEKYWLTRWF